MAMLGNPLLNIGLGILSQTGPSPYPQGMAGIGRGAMLGMQNLQQYQTQQMSNRVRQMQMDRIQREQERADSLRAAYADQFADHPMGALLGADTGLARNLMLQQLQPREPLKPTPLMQNLQSMGLQPGTPEFNEAMQQAMSKSGGPKVVGNSLVSPSGELIYQAPAGEPKPDDTFGNSLTGKMYELLYNYQSGTEADPNKIRMAEHYLTQPQTRNMPDGSVVQVVPGLPPGYTPIGSESTGAPGPVGSESTSVPAASDSGIKVLQEGKKERTESDLLNEAAETIESITNTLNEPVKNWPLIPGGPTSGIEGTLKSSFGGILRQFGIPVDTKAEKVASELEKLKAQIAPIITGEKGRSISDQDRKRIDKMIGSMSPNMDEEVLRDKLLNLMRFIKVRVKEAQ